MIGIFLQHKSYRRLALSYSKLAIIITAFNKKIFILKKSNIIMNHDNHASNIINVMYIVNFGI